MSAPVLKDLFGNDFTEGDRVVYSASNGIRVGKVEWIKPMYSASGAKHKVYINMEDHLKADGLARMRAPKVGYIHIMHAGNVYVNTNHHFLKV